MEFNSQICTTKEQSERLLALGLNKDTADMHHYKWSEGYWEIQSCPPRGTESYYIPAWSLHRLMEIGNFVNVGFLNIDKMYECCIRMIEGQIRGGVIDKKYLEE